MRAFSPDISCHKKRKFLGPTLRISFCGLFSAVKMQFFLQFTASLPLILTAKNSHLFVHDSRCFSRRYSTQIVNHTKAVIYYERFKGKSIIDALLNQAYCYLGNATIRKFSSRTVTDWITLGAPLHWGISARAKLFFYFFCCRRSFCCSFQYYHK